jgi:hypothetical protein
MMIFHSYVSLPEAKYPKKSQSTLQAVQEHLRREGHDVDTLILEIEARQLQGCENLGVLGGPKAHENGLCEPQNHGVDVQHFSYLKNLGHDIPLKFDG